MIVHTSNYAFKPIAEQALRSDQSVVPQRLNAALGFISEDAAMVEFTPEGQLRVLKEVESQCGLGGRRSVGLFVPGMEPRAISFYCGVLSELGLIEVNRLYDHDYDVYMPIRITFEGVEYLSEAKKAFWDHAGSVATDAFKHWTGINISSAVEFFRSAVRTFRQGNPNV